MHLPERDGQAAEQGTGTDADSRHPSIIAAEDTRRPSELIRQKYKTR